MSEGAAQSFEVAAGGQVLRGVRGGRGRPLVFFHGLGSDRGLSSTFLGAPGGFELVLPDLRGHGASSAVAEAAGFTLDAMVADVDALIERLDLQAPIVGGASMGAAVALAYAQARPGRAAALVLATPALGAEEHPEAAFFAGVGRRIEEAGLPVAADEAARALEARGLTADEADAAVAPWLGQDATSLALAMQVVPRWRLDDSGEALARIEAPVAIVAVAGDAWHPLALAERLHARLPASDLAVLPSVLDLFTPGSVGAAAAAGLARLGVGPAVVR